MAGVGQRVATATLRLEARGRNSIGWFYEGHDEQGCKELAMSVAAWDGFLNDQSNWPAASRIGNATGATTARDTLGDKTFVKRKRMSQEERHLQILQAAVKIIATKGFWGMSLQNISDELGITEAGVVPLHLLEGRSAQHGAVGMLRHHRCRRIQRGDGRHRRRRRAPRLLLPALLPEHRAVQSAAPPSSCSCIRC